MNQLLSHIEFLLHDHNCVVIPGFGGFVVNTIPPFRDGIALFHAPVCELVFNRELTHNDGLIAQSYMKNGGIAFAPAMQKVEEDVQELKRQLHVQRRLDMGRLGSFAMQDGERFLYTPGTFVRPGLFGLTRAALKPLIQLQSAVPVPEKESRTNWRRSAAISAVAVAVTALLMFILPVSDATMERQSARMISETGWLLPKILSPADKGAGAIIGVTETETETETETATETATETVIPAAGEEDTSIDAVGQETPAADAARSDITDYTSRYYIVMGVYRGVESAKKVTQQLIDEGFHQTEWLERPGRIDIYAASFTDKNAAEVYLKEVHKKFPKHSDAWILKK